MRYTITQDKDWVGPWLCNLTDKVWGPAGRECIGLFDQEGVLKAGVMFEDFTHKCITAHIALQPGAAIALRTLVPVACHYAFVTLGCEKILGLVNSFNRKALSLDLRLGFRAEAVIEGIYPNGDMVVLVMDRAECRWILPEHRKAA
jgi:hypothetical protein